MPRLRSCCFVLLIAARAAHAQDGADDQTREARADLKAGIAFYDQGRYEEAAQQIEAAYALRPLPDLQYNLAQCYERLGRYADSAGAYRKYLLGKPSAEDRPIIEQRLESLDARARQAKAGEKPAPPPVEKIVLKEVVIYREAPPPPGRGARFAAWGLVVVTAGALASGITFAVLASRDAAQVESGANPSAPPVFGGKYTDAETAGKTDVIVSWVSFGVAAAAAAGAVGLWALGRKIDREAPKLALAPLASPSGGGLALGGTF